jgi:hypothetical protein
MHIYMSYPRIWINNKMKIILLTNHRVGTFVIRLLCKRNKNYKKITNQKELKNNYNIDEYQIYLFTRNPYYRFLSTFLLFLYEKPTSTLLGNPQHQNLMPNIKKKYFNKKRNCNNITNFNYCLDQFDKYFDFFYENRLECNDGHWLSQTHNIIYDADILSKTTFIKFEELNKEENIKIINKLFNINTLPKRHCTTYKFNKKLYLQPKLIKIVNKYYSDDLNILNYTKL